MSAQNIHYPTGNSNNSMGPPEAGDSAALDPTVILTRKEENYPEEAMLDIIAQIKKIPIPFNPQGIIYQLQEKLELYKRLEAIVAFKKGRLEAEIPQYGGAHRRRKTKRRYTRRYR
jgi:hypothetical protein